MHASYKLGASLSENCIFHWPNGDQPLTLRSSSSSDKIALEATDCACGTGYCCMLISSVNRHLFYWIIVLIFVISCNFF